MNDFTDINDLLDHLENTQHDAPADEADYEVLFHNAEQE